MTKKQVTALAEINHTTPRKVLAAVQLGEYLTGATPIEHYVGGAPRVWRNSSGEHFFVSSFLSALHNLERFYRGYLR
jgi:hypothetical protein